MLANTKEAIVDQYSRVAANARTNTASRCPIGRESSEQLRADAEPVDYRCSINKTIKNKYNLDSCLRAVYREKVKHIVWTGIPDSLMSDKYLIFTVHKQDFTLRPRFPPVIAYVFNNGIPRSVYAFHNGVKDPREGPSEC
jgi:hypothetical protein